MKKIFPWIVLLITLSLTGIIAIQVSWIHNAVIMRREQFNQRMLQVLDDTRMELINRNPLPGVLPGGFGFNGDAFSSPVSIGRAFSATDIKKIIQRNMEEHGLEAPFQFAIEQNSLLGRNNEVYSGPEFIAQYHDTLHYKQFFTVLGNEQDIVNSFLSRSSEYMVITVPADNRAFVLKSLGWIIIGALLFTLIIIAAFALTIYTMLRQKKLSEIKSDFINNMTHEFKTPLATISLAVDAIGNHKVLDNRDKIKYFTGIIKQENKRMNKQVETILQSALLDKQEEIRLDFAEADVHEIIQKNIVNLELQLQNREGKIEAHLDATDSRLMVDEVHFSNMISNLLDNALKYSKNNPQISIQTWNTKKGIAIAVSDNGIGMSKETQARIFEKFYRAHTGNLHDVKGFGLGLAYVKAIVEAHHGKIRVESVVGKGSCFDIEFPQLNKSGNKGIARS